MCASVSGARNPFVPVPIRAHVFEEQVGLGSVHAAPPCQRDDVLGRRRHGDHGKPRRPSRLSGNFGRDRDRGAVADHARVCVLGEHRGSRGFPDRICGDDAEAKGAVAGLIEDMGYVPVDLGGTHGCHVMEAPSPAAGGVRRGVPCGGRPSGRGRGHERGANYHRFRATVSTRC